VLGCSQQKRNYSSTPHNCFLIEYSAVSSPFQGSARLSGAPAFRQTAYQNCMLQTENVTIARSGNDGYFIPICRGGHACTRNVSTFSQTNASWSMTKFTWNKITECFNLVLKTDYSEGFVVFLSCSRNSWNSNRK
jgi:hypothetical protein